MILEFHASFDPGDLAWMLLATVAVVVLYLPGLALFYCGMLRKANLAVLAKQSLLWGSLLSVTWCFWIYSLAFAPSLGTVPFDDPETAATLLTNFESMILIEDAKEDISHTLGRGGLIGGTDYLAFQHLAPQGGTGEAHFPTRRPFYHLPHMVFMFYQMMLFLAVPVPLAVILSERIRWAAVLLFAVLWGTVVYAPLVHWVWGDGWLGERGAVDTGGGLLHVGVGFSALACAFVFGRRSGTEVLTPANESPPDSSHRLDDAPVTRLAILGAAMFWAGAMLVHAAFAMKPNGQATVACFNSHLAAAAGLLAWTGTSWFVHRRFDPVASAAGSVAGLAAIATGAGVVAAPSALIIGILAGIVGSLAYEGLCLRGRENGPLIVFIVQGCAGSLGLLLTGVFAVSNMGVLHWDGRPVAGLIESGDIHTFFNQALALGTTAALAYGGTWLILTLIRFLPGPAQSDLTEQFRP